MPYRSASWYSRIAKATARYCGHPGTFVLALVVILSWLISGPFYHFSDSWQIVINTATTIVTFLMVFLIQNTQYRDTEAIQIKLDELIRATHGAHNALLDLEELEETELDLLRSRYLQLARNAREKLKLGIEDTNSDETDSLDSVSGAAASPPAQQK
jgi:low affinity Fe/Cu permease